MAVSTAAVDTSGEAPLSRLRKQYKDFLDTKQQEQKEAREARHYYHGDQWTEAELKVLRKRKQPPVTYNRVGRKIDGVVGIVEKLRQDPKAYPRNPQDEQDSETATKAIRYALDQAMWPDAESEGTRSAGIDGIGVVEMVLEPGDSGVPGDFDIDLDLVDSDTFFYDPRSFRHDFSDARYMGVAKWLSVEQAAEMFPDQAEALDGMMSGGGDLAGIDQQDRDKIWLNTDKRRVRVVEHWYKQAGEWVFCFYAADLELAKGPSPFKDEKGRTIPKYLAFSAYVDHDGDRYGLVRNLKSAQDEINMRRSKALHLMHTRRVITEKGAVDDVEKARAESARPDGFIEVQRGFRFEYDDAAKQAEMASQMEMLMEAKAEIENFGPTLQEKGNDKSGRAIALLQQAGLAELGPFLRAYRAWKLRVYRAVWCAMRSHWKAERWIRVTDEQESVRFMGVNQLAFDEMGQSVIQNQMSALDVDILLDDSPDTLTTMQDVFELMQSMAAAGVQFPPSIVIEMSGLPSSLKQRLISMLEQAQQAAPPDPMMEQAKMIALEQEQSQTAVNKATAMDRFASAAQKMGQAMMPPPPPQQGQGNAARV